MNLWNETVQVIESEGREWSDVIAVVALSSRASIPLDVFERVARETNYDEGFGGQEVASDLCVVGKGFWMTRGEYDGSEWWQIHEYPDVSGFTIRDDLSLLAIGENRYGDGGVWSTVASKNGWEDIDG